MAKQRAVAWMVEWETYWYTRDTRGEYWKPTRSVGRTKAEAQSCIRHLRDNSGIRNISAPIPLVRRD